MDQSPGFIDKSHPDYVCKLHKAIYGLRQAPRAWYTEFKNFITSIGFVCSQSDPFLFILHGTDSVVFILLYVDNIILTGSSQSRIFHVNNALARHFFSQGLISFDIFSWH